MFCSFFFFIHPPFTLLSPWCKSKLREHAWDSISRSGVSEQLLQISMTWSETIAANKKLMSVWIALALVVYRKYRLTSKPFPLESKKNISDPFNLFQSLWSYFHLYMFRDQNGWMLFLSVTFGSIELSNHRTFGLPDIRLERYSAPH